MQNIQLSDNQKFQNCCSNLIRVIDIIIDRCSKREEPENCFNAFMRVVDTYRGWHGIRQATNQPNFIKCQHLRTRLHNINRVFISVYADFVLYRKDGLLKLHQALNSYINPCLSNSNESIDKCEESIEGTLPKIIAPSPFIPNKIDFNLLELPADKFPVYLEYSTLTIHTQNHLAALDIFTFSALWSFSQDNTYIFFYNDYKKKFPRVLLEIEDILFDMANCNWSRVYKNWSD